MYRALVERLDSLLERVVIVVPGGRLDVHEVVVETAERFHQLDEIPLDIGHLPGDLRAFRSRKHRRSDATLARKLLLRLAHLHQVFASLNEGVDLRKERSLAEIPPPGFVVPRPAVHGALRGHVARLPRLPRGDGVPQRLLAVPQVGTVQDVLHRNVPAAPVDHLGGDLSKQSVRQLGSRVMRRVVPNHANRHQDGRQQRRDVRGFRRRQRLARFLQRGEKLCVVARGFRLLLRDVAQLRKRVHVRGLGRLEHANHGHELRVPQLITQPGHVLAPSPPERNLRQRA
mmetsp:Transcript_13472/g.52940  ORF Transcript_13472/g.52940 Transcript_13472/m.52940 type:complete len:286 (-) Transcript_13472:715-1572(-)